MITVMSGRRITAIAGSAALLAGLGIAGASGPAHATAASPAAKSEKTDNRDSCHLGNGIKHVVQLTFDNVHFFRDNPNVPSDLELMPNLLNFFEDNGTFLSNNHTPLIAHTANDILTTLTGLYGDRHGVGISNSYQAYNTDGPGGTFNTTDPASAFAYWTDSIFDSAKTPNANHDTNPNMVYSPVPPATAKTPVTPNTVTPAPWVPYTRAGCDWGAVATANVELENTGVDLSTVFGAFSPEVAQLNTPTLTRSRTRRPRTTWASPCTARRAARSAPARPPSSSARPRRPAVLRLTCCLMSLVATTGSRRCSGTSTWHRSLAPAPRTSRRTASR